MPLLEEKELNEKNLLKLLKKSIKKIVLDNGIDTNTKKGNKELNFLLKKIGKLHFNSFEQVQTQGEKIGQLIVKLSNERGKIALDQGVIQHIILKEDLSFLGEVSTGVSPKTTKPVVETPIKEVISTPVSKVEEEEEQINSPVETVEIEDKYQEEDEHIHPTHPVEVEADEIIDDEEEVEESMSPPVVEKDEEEEPVKTGETATLSSKDLTSMSLKDRIGEDIKTAMKTQDKIRLETVRGIKKVIVEKEVSLRPSEQENLTSEQEIEVLTQQAKQRRDSIEQYTNAGRNDLADKEAQELAIIETYLPKQLSNEELTAIIDDIVASVGATSAKDLGKVMGVAMKQLKGKADGKKIQEMVKSQLS